jgi:hypothetical protein
MRNALILGTVSLALAVAAIAWFAEGAPDIPDAPEAAPKARRTSRAADLPDPPSKTKNRRAAFRLDNTPMDPPASTVARIAPTRVGTEVADVATVSTPEALPNVVLVLGCTVRKDQLTPYGAGEDVTPFLADLAARGTVFDDTIAAAPWTRAASTALLTGKHAVSIGAVEPGDGRNDRRVPDSATLLAERFAALDYYTLGATANPNLVEGFGFAQGMADYQGGLKVDWETILHGPEIVRGTTEALDQHRSTGDHRPFFMQLMLIDAHGPRTALPDEFASYQEEGEPDRMAQYRHHLHKLDKALSLLDRQLRSQGFDETNTLFVFVADHGEGLNFPRQHGFAHGQYHGSSTNHVPWIVAGPGVAKGHRILGPTSQVDLVPTLLGLVGRPVDDPSLEGADLSDLVRGNGHLSPHDKVWSDTWFGESSRAAVFTHTHQCQQDFGSSQRQVSKGKFMPGCFDRHADPLFATPITKESLMRELIDWRKAKTAALDSLATEVVPVDEALNEQLILLGYKE